MTSSTRLFGLHVLINQHFEDTLERVKTALKAAGFEILAEINLSEVLAKKTQTHPQPYKIFVVFNPDLANRTLTIAPQAAVLLPCNVAVAQLEVDLVEVTIAAPFVELGVPLEAHLKPIADELSAHLEHVIYALKG